MSYPGARDVLHATATHPHLWRQTDETSSVRKRKNVKEGKGWEEAGGCTLKCVDLVVNPRRDSRDAGSDR